MADDLFDIGNYSDGELMGARDLFERHYETLKSIARANRRKRQLGDTLETTEIVHNAYVKLQAEQRALSEEHFKRMSALAIRQVIVDHARNRLAGKRGHGKRPVPLDEHSSKAILPEFSETPEEILVVSSLLKEMAKVNARWMRIVDLRYFAGFSEVETASALGVTDRTIRRDWQAIREWLAPRMGVILNGGQI